MDFPGIGPEKTVHAFEECAFPAPACSHKRANLPSIHLNIDVLESGNISVTQ